MNIHIVLDYIEETQRWLFKCANENPNSIGRLGSIPIAVIDVSLHTVNGPILAIEFLAKAIIHTVGALFSDSYSIGGAIDNLELSFGVLGFIVGCAVTSPLNLIYQVVSLILDPEHAKSRSFD